MFTKCFTLGLLVAPLGVTNITPGLALRQTREGDRGVVIRSVEEGRDEGTKISRRFSRMNAD